MLQVQSTLLIQPPRAIAQEAANSHDASNVGNVIRSKRVGSTSKNHPTEKPVDLMQQILCVVVPEGGTVVDPFMGSGSTGVACVRNGVNFLGCDIDSNYIGVAKRRITGAGMPLFDRDFDKAAS